MLVGIMATDGGTHSPETEAIATAGQIIQIGSDAIGQRAIEGRKLELKIIDLLEERHAAVKQSERAALVERGHAQLSTPIEPIDHVDAAAAAVTDAAKGTAFAEHFATSDAQRYLRAVLGQHFATSIWNERDWHAKGFVVGADHKAAPNPRHDAGDAHVKRWMTRHYGVAA